ncbi:hypothetical protein [Myroides odoratimimus]|uniref:hypothetical protein n=1 Tax=Myroides odoratimimus TaxID=76832 RepID=UPI002577676E|nr:hypothetical protein [Myroides odoratimimus]MDM1463883.1 hypothetical protein [Myroides odoratimimus]MDM1473734.1 hypothetical protein [Myroides odoratimimus]
MKLKPIKSEQDYQAALQRLELIFNALPGTQDSDELESLGILIEKYEKEHFPMDLSNPIEASKSRIK